ncbi:MAG: UMP kinase [Promethearchaeota archaeon]
MKNKIIVIKTGGSLLFTEEKTINSRFLSEFSKIIKSASNFDKIIIVSGGGVIARDYINTIRNFGGNEALCDTFGIDVSRLNARIFISCLGEDTYPLVPKSIEDLSIALLSRKITVIGGLQPGQSTTSVSLEVSEYVNAEKMIILTNVDGIYDKDPNQYSDAKIYKYLTYKELEKLILSFRGENQAAAGEYRIFDVVSLQILKRSKIPIQVMNGKDLTAFARLMQGEQNVQGTHIIP